MRFDAKEFGGRTREIKSNLNPRFAEKEGDYTGTVEYNAEH